MAEELCLALLGGMRITQGGEPLSGFVSAKAPAVLCYLAATGRPQFRLVLAGLLWGDLPEADACANLRKILSNLRHLVGSHLIITPQTVAINRQGLCHLDVEAFQERVDRHMSHGQRTLSDLSSAACLLDWTEAAALYQGDFLEGFYVRNAPAFEEWVAGQREHLRQTAARVFETLATYHAARGAYAMAIDYTSRLLALDPWREEAHRQMMVLLAHSGQRCAALAQYEICRRILAQELGIQPTAETNELYRRLRAMETPRPHNLPASTTSFVGREDELAQVARLLADADCRLLTIVGPGGVGKTRLALQAACEILSHPDGAFPDGIYDVPLVSVNSAQTLISTIVKTVGLTSAPGADALGELLHYLHSKDLLLCLDGFEHLVQEARLLSTLLRGAAGVKLLVTSRQRLNLQGEWLMELNGLPAPPLGAVENLETYSAFRLFMHRAQQARAHFTASARDRQAIAYACELVGGLPLAIELAAAWVKSMSCGEIAQAIESNLDALTAFVRDIPSRHQSVRASLDHSWNLLSGRERQVFRRLAVFRSGFTREAADRVAGAEPAILIALTEKSLLRRDLAGRYTMHALVWQYAYEKLCENETEHAELDARHARYYLAEFMPQRERELWTGHQAEALDSFRAEHGNVQVAWRWAADTGRVHEIGRALLSLALVCDMLGWWEDAAADFARAVDGLRDRIDAHGDRDRIETITLGALLAVRGSYCVRIGLFDQAKKQLQASLAMFQVVRGQPREAAFPLLGLALLADLRGQLVDAQAHLRQALAIVRHAGDDLLTAFTLDHLGEISSEMGEHLEAGRLLEEALALHRTHNEQWGIGRALFGLGQAALRSGHLDEAKRLLTESRAIFAGLGALVAAARAQCALGAVACAAGELAQARLLLEECRPVLEASQNTTLAARCTEALDRVTRALG